MIGEIKRYKNKDVRGKRPRLLLAVTVLLFAMALPLSPARAQECAPSNGLVGHWKLDELSGTTAADSAGSNDGSMPESIPFRGSLTARCRPAPPAPYSRNDPA